jgi:Mannosyltransferase (PIG-V)
MAVSVGERPASALPIADEDRSVPSTGAVALSALLFTRLPVLAVGLLAVVLVGTNPPPVAEALWRVSSQEMTNLLARWDTAYYYSIATTGYAWNPQVFRHENVVFFPLYPLMMRWGGTIIGGHPLLAGLVISLVAFTAAIAILYRLAIVEVGPDHAWRAILLLVTFPYAFFYSAVYTESLFLLLSVGAFYAMRRGQLTLCALAGLAIGLTRPNGFWLSLPLALLGWTRIASGRDQPESRFRQALSLAAACAPLIGVALYSTYLHMRFEDAFAWVAGQRAWGVPLLGRAGAPDPAPLPWQAHYGVEEIITWVGNIIAFAAAALAVRPVARRFGAAYAIWIAVNIFPPFAAHLFLSLGRFASVLFPMFFWLAIQIPRRRLIPIAVAFAAGQTLLAAWFFLWQPVV